MAYPRTIRGKWRPEWTSRTEFSALHAAVEGCLGMAESVAGARAAIERDKAGILTSRGIAQETRARLASGPRQELLKHRKALADAKAAVKTARDQFKPPAPDKTDLVGELQRQELRSFLRGLGPADKLARIRQDPAFALAALGAPLALSGLKEEAREQVEAHYANAVHGEAIAGLEERSEAVFLADLALRGAMAALREETGLSEQAFETWLDTGEEPPEGATRARSAALRPPQRAASDAA